MAADKPGGYNYELVCKSGQERYVCWICHNLLREPTLTSCCGQHYCWKCLQKWFEQCGHKTCPQCCKEFTYMVNQERKRDVLDLKVKCTYHTLGCCFTIKLKNMDEHVVSCSNVQIPCKLNCTKKIKHIDHEKHVEYECLNREYECEFCQYKSTYTEITGETAMTPHNPAAIVRPIPQEKGHYAKCPEYPKTCPNECGKTIKRKHVLKHCAVCPKERDRCSNRGRGLCCWFTGRCNQVMERQLLANHEKYECLYRSYTCQFCNIEDTYAAITGETVMKKHDPSSAPKLQHDAILNPPPERGHYAECERYPLHCPNKCRKEVILRKDMPFHRRQCPLEPVECPFREAGCQVKPVRKDLDGHVKNSTTKHLTGLLGAFTETKKELKETKKELKETKKELKETKKELEETKIALAETQARLPPPKKK